MLYGDLDKFDPENPAEGMYINMPEVVYRGANAWNWSVLRKGAGKGGTMSKVKYAKDTQGKDEDDTADKLMGRCFDIVHLQRPRVGELIAVVPPTYPFEKSTGRGAKKITEEIDKPWNGNATFCRNWIKQQNSEGREVLRAKQRNRLVAMADSLDSIAAVREMVEGALIQPCIFWRDPQTGLMCKAKLDCYKAGRIGDDKKVAKSAAWEPFSGHVLAYKIHCQAAMYLDGINALLKLSGEKPPNDQRVRIMVVEDFPPHDAAVYDMVDNPLSDSYLWLKAGRDAWHGVLQQVAFCLKHGAWPGLNTETSTDGLTEAMSLTTTEWVQKRLGVTE